MKSFRKDVVAGILPVVEGGISPPEAMADLPCAADSSEFHPQGWKPGSTAGVDACRHGNFRKGLVAVLVLAAFAPSPLFACAACYGKSDSPLASGMNAGIFTLLGVILSVLTCFALFFVHVIRGEAKSQNDDSTPNPTPKNPTDV